MEYLYFAYAFLYGLAVLVGIPSIGKPRNPASAADVILSSVVGTGLVVLLIMAGIAY